MVKESTDELAGRERTQDVFNSEGPVVNDAEYVVSFCADEPTRRRMKKDTAMRLDAWGDLLDDFVVAKSRHVVELKRRR